MYVHRILYVRAVLFIKAPRCFHNYNTVSSLSLAAQPASRRPVTVLGGRPSRWGLAGSAAPEDKDTAPPAELDSEHGDLASVLDNTIS